MRLLSLSFAGLALLGAACAHDSSGSSAAPPSAARTPGMTVVGLELARVP